MKWTALFARELALLRPRGPEPSRPAPAPAAPPAVLGPPPPAVCATPRDPSAPLPDFLLSRSERLERLQDKRSRGRPPAPRSLARRILPATISVALHSFVILMLSLIFFRTEIQEAFVPVRIHSQPDLPPRPALPMAEIAKDPSPQPQPPEVPVPQNPHPAPEGRPDQPPVPQPQPAPRTDDTTGLAGATAGYGQRDPGGRAQRLARYGGNADTEGAVTAALDWLARHQLVAGNWSLSEFPQRCPEGAPCPGIGTAYCDVGATGLALLAFLGAGHTGESGVYREAVERGLDWLREQQRQSGEFSPDLYQHGIATFALAEACGLTRQEPCGRAAKRALAYLAGGQQKGGGWDYRVAPSGRSDLSVTGWQVMALRAAELAEIELPPKLLERAGSYARASYDARGRGLYADSGMGQARTSLAMDAVSLLCRLYTGVSPSSEALARSAELLERDLPDRRRAVAYSEHSYYYYYYGTLVSFHLGGELWEAWNPRLIRELLPLQCQEDEHRRGAFQVASAWYDQRGGAVYCTALAALMLEVYYRYRPLSEHGPPPSYTLPQIEALLADERTPAQDKIEALEQVPTPATKEHLGALAAALASDSAKLRELALRRLANCPEQAAFADLLQSLTHPDRMTRWHALRALGQRGDVPSAQALLDHYDRAAEDLKPACVEALSRCGKAADFLRQAAQDPVRSEPQRQAARAALELRGHRPEKKGP